MVIPKDFSQALRAGGGLLPGFAGGWWTSPRTFGWVVGFSQLLALAQAPRALWEHHNLTHGASAFPKGGPRDGVWGRP